MRLLLVAAALLALWPATVHAQSAVLQGGPVTPGHLSMYAPGTSYQTVVQDSGTANGGVPNANPKELGITVRGSGVPPYANAGVGPLNTNFCDYDAPTTNSTGYHYWCLSPNAQGGGIMVYGHSPAAAALPLYFDVNGTTYQFPFTTSGTIGPSTTTIGDFATWGNTVGTLLADTPTITFSQMPSIANDTVLCNTSGSTGKPQACDSLPQGIIFSTQAANTVFAGPASGSAAAPAFRSLTGADLPVPGPSSLGGVDSYASPSHQFLSAINTDGSINSAQPAYSDLSGTTNAVTNAALAQAPGNTFKGNSSGSTANVTDMTAAQAAAILPAFVGDSGSGGTQGLVPRPSAGEAAQGRILGADGSWDFPGVGAVQAWQVTAKNSGTVYQNTENSPIEIAVTLSLASNQNAQLLVGTTTTPATEIESLAAGGGAATVSPMVAIIPAGIYYKVTTTGAVTIWSELR